MENYDFFLQGDVGSYFFSARYVDYMLSGMQDRPVNILVSSYGGSLPDAIRICESFRRHGNVSLHYTGFNASAATLIAMGAKHVSMDASAFWLVHKVMMPFDVYGNFNEKDYRELIEHMEDIRSDLSKFDGAVVSLYCDKCKKTAAEMFALMERDCWLSSTEAKEWGFVDEIKNATPKDIVKNEATPAVFMKAGLPIPNSVQFAPRPNFIEQAADFIQSVFTKIKTNMKNQPDTIPAAEIEEQPATPAPQPEDTAAEDTTPTSDDAPDFESRLSALEDRVERMTARQTDTPLTTQVVENVKESPADDFCSNFSAAVDAVNMYK